MNYTSSDRQEYMTVSNDIVSLMTNLIGNVDNCEVLEPSVGKGSLIRNLIGKPKRIDAVDIDYKYMNFVRDIDNVKAINCDFIEDVLRGEDLLFRSEVLKNYDAVISNPPYGLKFSKEYRKTLKAKYPNLYVRESYALFLIFSISKLKDNGKYVFIIPDTFLYSSNHKSTRKFLMNNGAVESIFVFPSKRFESVNFGYANLCIISGYKRPQADTDSVVFYDYCTHTGLLTERASEASIVATGKTLKQDAEIGWNYIQGQTNAVPSSVNFTTLGELAECKTGIYTGDNERFLGYDARRLTRKANGHALVWATEMYTEHLSVEARNNGLLNEKTYVPIVRGGHRAPFDQTEWGICWTPEALKYYRTDKKARFQNSSYYFRAGLAVPMVTSGRLTASQMENSVFDQGVVGIFPHNEALIPFLLVYLNCEYASEVAKPSVNPSANNSANYLRRLPVPVPTADLLSLAKEIYDVAKNGTKHFEKSRMLDFQNAITSEDSL